MTVVKTTFANGKNPFTSCTTTPEDKDLAQLLVQIKCNTAAREAAKVAHELELEKLRKQFAAMRFGDSLSCLSGRTELASKMLRRWLAKNGKPGVVRHVVKHNNSLFGRIWLDAP